MNDALATAALAVNHDPFAGPALTAFAPITESQREIWLACSLDPALNVGYNEGIELRLEGELDVDILRCCLQILVDRHESLRMTISPDGAWLCVLEKLGLDVPLIEAGSDIEVAAAGRDAMRDPFDLRDGPLIRFVVVRRSPQLGFLMFVAHHIVCDGWSTAVLLTELGELYSQLAQGRETMLAEPPKYTTYAANERDFLDSSEGLAQEVYWLNNLDSPPASLSLPTDRVRAARRDFSADRYDHALPVELAARLRKTAAAQGASLVATLLATFAVLLHRLTQAEDLVIGLAAAGQSALLRSNLVGHCVNLLPLRLRPRGAMSFKEFLMHARSAVLDATDNQGVTFGRMLQKLRLDRDTGRPALVAVTFNIDVRDDDISHSGLVVSYKTLVRSAEVFEMFVNVVDDGAGLLVECSYNSALFDRGTIKRRIREYQTLIESVCEDPQQLLSRLAMMSSVERDTILQRFASPDPLPLRDATVHGRVAAQAMASPDAIAVECGDTSWTYRQLLARAGAIATALTDRGVRAGDFVGVCLHRTPELPASLLAVLQCGAAYVPLDPDLPRARLDFMAADAEIEIVLCESDTVAPAPQGVRQLRLDTITNASDGDASIELPANAAAYAIYTSGSTGKPKGVVAHHQGVLNCLAGTVQRIPVGPDDRVLALATYAFDASVLEIFLPLVYGARLVMVTREQAADGRLLAAAIARHEVTRIFTAPAAWRLLLGAGWSGDASIVGVSWAEPLTRELAAELLPRLGQLWNLYGPTETTVWMLGARVTDPAAPITIGRPIPNTRAYILDAGQQPVPIGVVGELCIGGAGVALGYLHRPELDAERFVPDPFWDGRMYRTGDLARWTADGEVECLGRADQQVKLRGYRIEPGEIESALAHHPAVADCVCGVCERAPGDPRLVAWVQFRNGESLTAAELRAHLRQDLPGYMIPQHFVDLPQLPRLDNGKLDRKNLPDPFLQVPARITRTPPTGSIEQAIASIWQEILGGTALPGRDDRFIDLGGHSLLAVQVAARVHARLGVRLPLRDVMMEPLSALALSAGPTPPEPAREPAMPDPGAAVVPRGVGALARLKRWLGS